MVATLAGRSLVALSSRISVTIHENGGPQLEERCNGWSMVLSLCGMEKDRDARHASI
jgi:hypothetical protein